VLHWEIMKKHNNAAKMMKNDIRFVPYGTRKTLPILGKARVVLPHRKFDACHGSKGIPSQERVQEAKG
jgi:hypothetical protein